MLIESTQIAVIAREKSIDVATAESLVSTLLPLAEDAAAIMLEAEGVTVTDATQVTEIKKSRRLRLDLGKVRVLIDKARIVLKDESLRRVQFIDEIARFVRVKIEAVESRLEAQEKFAERVEAERRSKLKATRQALLTPFGVDGQFFALDQMPDDQFATLLDSSRIAHESKVAAAAKAEVDRIAAEQAAKAEQERVRAENDRLREENAAKDLAAAAERNRVEAERRATEAAAAEERRKADAAIKAERDAREALEAKAKAEQAERERAAAAEAKAKAKAERAPDRDKIIALSQAVAALSVPTLTTPDGRRVQRVVENTIKSCAGAILELAKELQ